MALLDQDIIIKDARSVGKEIIAVEGNESRERPKIHTIPLIKYKCMGKEGLQKMWEEILAENEGVAISVQV